MRYVTRRALKDYPITTTYIAVVVSVILLLMLFWPPYR